MYTYTINKKLPAPGSEIAEVCGSKHDDKGIFVQIRVEMMFDDPGSFL
jgi:hypothetical protein